MDPITLSNRKWDCTASDETTILRIQSEKIEDCEKRFFCSENYIYP